MSSPAHRVRRSCILPATFVACVLLAGCASAPPDSVTQTNDPWQGMNRKIYAFNDALDKAVARPVARTYVRAMPGPARNGIHNAVTNIDEPVTVVNDVLQGKVGQGLRDLGRFVINSTVGLLGWFDVAKHVGLPHHDEDLGQTLATWHVPSGPYVVLPFLGPSTVRDTFGRGGDVYADPVRDALPPRWRNAEYVVDALDTRVGLMGTNEALDSAYDPYVFMRDAYIQNRRYKIYDGNPPAPDYDYDLPPDDSTSSPPASVTPAPAAASTAAPPAGSIAAPAAGSTAAPSAATH
ncbi:MAG TPA: VacJ family lipoprotein [Gammaproteobacteria bacterium]|nr:VacJ family lipoprotein [Gammaproteobacteria bacterium]